MNKARFEAFSDGVFAFAITLLVLGLVLPEFKTPPSDADLARALLALWPNLVAYALSFAVIGIMWQNHHALFRLVHTVDRMTVFLNLGLLGLTVFIPFSTSVLGAHPTLRTAAFFYGLNLTGTGTFYNLILNHLMKRRAFQGHVTDATLKQTIHAYRVGWATYATAMLSSLVAPLIGFALYLLVAAYYLVPRGVDTDTTSGNGA
jgi:uncharacterized membrane protein